MSNNVHNQQLLKAHCLADQRFNGTDYKQGDPFPLEGLAQWQIDQLRASHYITFGDPSTELQALIDRRKAKIALQAKEAAAKKAAAAPRAK